MPKRFLLYISAAILTCLISCGGESTNSISDDEMDKLIANEKAVDSNLIGKGVQEKLDYIIENLQTSDNLIRKLSKNTNLFSDAILNDIEKATEYETARTKALNLGIYGADLNYLIHFSQSQTSFKYLLTSKQLADQIGVAMAFDQSVIDEYQSNSENKDTLLNIVFSAYKDVKKLLKNNEQFQLSTLVIAGSWIENLYLTTQLLPNSTNNEQHSQIIADIKGQRNYLHKIRELLIILNQEEDPYVKEVLDELVDIDSVYSKIEGEELDDKMIAELNLKIRNVRNNLSLNK